MEAMLGGGTILILLAGIMSGRMSSLAALTLLPIAAALIAGHGTQTGTYIVHGIQNMGPIIGLLVFAILFFGVVADAGLFDPLIATMLNLAGSSPTRIVIATTVVATIVHLDGAGAVTFIVTVTAFLPVYERLGIDRRVLACVVSAAAGVANMLPWGGPTLRAAAALDVPLMELYKPLIPIQLVGHAAVLAVAYFLGRRETKRLKAVPVPGEAATQGLELPQVDLVLRRPHLFWINAALTAAVITVMIVDVVPPVVAFMVGTIIALILNYRGQREQRERMDAHARSSMMMVTVLLAAGVFTGIMEEGGFLGALAKASVAHISPDIAMHVPVLLGVVSMPLSLLFDPDSFYFGILPVLAESSAHFGIPEVQVAHAALIGQMTTGFPVSPLTPATYLLVGLAGIELGAHQRFTIPYLFFISMVMAAACVILGLFPL